MRKSYIVFQPKMTASKIIAKLNSMFVGLERRPWLAGSWLAVIFLTLFSFLQRHPTILDSDAFYHAKMAQFLSQGIIIKDFPWLPFTILADYYTDHHFLYHVVLAPFVWVFDPLIAMKVAIVVLGVAALLVYFWALRRLGAVGAFWWTILAATSWPFLFRLNLVKALPLSLIIFLLGLVALKEKRRWLLALLSFIYVWTYNAWPILFATVLVYSLITFYLNWRKNLRDGLLPLLFAFLSNVVGLVLNPYFPNNLWFSWKHIVGIGLIPTSTNLVGQEWLRYSLPQLYLGAAPLFIFLLVLAFVLVIVVIEKRRLPFIDRPERIFCLTIIITATALFFATIISRRYVEYFIPVAYLGMALFFTVLARSSIILSSGDLLNKWTHSRPLAAIILSVVFFVLIGANAYQVTNDVDKKLRGGYPLTHLRKVSLWLQYNLPANEVVFNLLWDDFTALFYFNDKQRYGVGLDSRFLKRDGYDTMLVWEKLFRGLEKNPAKIFKETFRTKYVLISYFHPNKAIDMFRAYNWPVIYEDAESTVYAIP